MVLFQEASVLVCEVYMIEFTATHLWLNFFCRDLTCIVYFKHNAYVRITIYSSLSSFLHNELLSNKFETPDVNFNTQDVRLDVQLPFLRYYISWGGVMLTLISKYATVYL